MFGEDMSEVANKIIRFDFEKGEWTTKSFSENYRFMASDSIRLAFSHPLYAVAP